MKYTNESVDIPQCPHKYISLETLSYQNSSKWTTLGLSAVAYAINGVYMFAPFTAEHIKIEYATSESFDK
jgi:hypothetical protein